MSRLFYRRVRVSASSIQAVVRGKRVRAYFGLYCTPTEGGIEMVNAGRLRDATTTCFAPMMDGVEQRNYGSVRISIGDGTVVVNLNVVRGKGYIKSTCLLSRVRATAIRISH